MTENWLPVAGWLGLYEVSDRGRVRSLDRVLEHGRYGKQRLQGKVLRPGLRGPKRKAYPSVILCNVGERASKMVHLLMLEAFVGPCPPGHEARHLDDIETNNVIANLRWGTKKENSADSARNGHVRRGSRSGVAKFTEDAVLAIRALIETGMPIAQIARNEDVDHKTIRQIRDRKTWTHI